MRNRGKTRVSYGSTYCIEEFVHAHAFILESRVRFQCVGTLHRDERVHATVVWSLDTLSAINQIRKQLVCVCIFK